MAPPMRESGATVSLRRRTPRARATTGIRNVVLEARLAPKWPAAFAITTFAMAVPMSSANTASRVANDSAIFMPTRIDGIAPGSYAILHRVHHAAIDGVSGAHAFVAMNDIDADGTPAVMPKEPDFEVGRMPGAAEIATRAFLANALSPARLTNAVLRMTPSLLAAAGKTLSAGAAPLGSVPETRFNHAQVFGVIF